MYKRTIRRSYGERGFFGLLAAIIFLWLLQIGLAVGVVIVALHFITKYW